MAGPCFPGDIYEEERADDGSLRVNPAWYKLEDFPPDLLVKDINVRWIYTVDEDGEIALGRDQMVLNERQVASLAAAMHEKDPSITGDKLHDKLTGLGHPTVAVGFDPDGRTRVGSARISGELWWNEDETRFEINEDSGRYMHPEVRSETDRVSSDRFARQVAKRMTQRFGTEVYYVWD